MDIDEKTSSLLLEIRNEEQKQVRFASVNLAALSVNFDSYQVDERWHTGIETAINGVMLLHYYQNTGSPVHKGITAVDCLRGQTLWSNFALGFNSLSADGPVMYNTQLSPPRNYVYDAGTGKVLRPFNPGTDVEPLKQITVPGYISPAQLPHLQLTEELASPMIYYLEHNKYRIVSLHTRSNGLLKQYLFVLDEQGIVYQDLLMANIQKLQPEAFVLHKNWLICLKNKTEILVLEL